MAARTGPGPTALRMKLGKRLRSLREARGITREAAGEAIRGSAAKISRLELGRVGLRERDVVDLLGLYGVGVSERAPLLDLLQQSNTPPWWHRYGDLLPQWFETYLGLEQASSVIRTYECQYVPGLLQTREYALEVTELGHQDPDVIRRRLSLRMERQQVLDGPGAPVLWAVIDQAVLAQLMAQPALGRGQLKHLVEQSARPNVRIQIAGFEHGGLPTAGGAFNLLRFASEELPDVVYLEQLTSAQFLDRPRDVEFYTTVMDLTCSQVYTPAQSRVLLQEMHDQL